MSELEQVRPCSAVEYLSGKPALLFATSWRRRAAAEPALEACGVRLVDSIPIAEAAARLDDQVSLGLAWLELGEEDATAELELLLARLDDLAETRGTIVIAAVPLELVDMVAAGLTGRSTEILVNPDESQRAAALAIALSEALEEHGVSDAGHAPDRRYRALARQRAGTGLRACSSVRR